MPRRIISSDCIEEQCANMKFHVKLRNSGVEVITLPPGISGANFLKRVMIAEQLRISKGTF